MTNYIYIIFSVKIYKYVHFIIRTQHIVLYCLSIPCASCSNLESQDLTYFVLSKQLAYTC